MKIGKKTLTKAQEQRFFAALKERQMRARTNFQERTRARPGAVGEGQTPNTPEEYLEGFDPTKYRLHKALRASLYIRRHGEKEAFAGAAYEREVHHALLALREGREDMRTRTATLGNDENLGILVPAMQMPEVVDPLRTKTAIDQIGVTRMSGLRSVPVTLPRQTGTTSFEWLGETGPHVPSDVKVDFISLTPKTCGASTRMQKSLLTKDGPAAEPLLRKDLGEVMARGQDQAFFLGTNVNGQPRGMDLLTPSAHAIDFTSADAVTVWQKLMDMFIAIGQANANADAATWIFNWTDWYNLAKVQLPQAANNVGYPVLSDGNVTQGIPRQLYGRPVVLQTNVPQGIVRLGDYSDAIFADWGAIEVVATQEGETLVKNRQVFIATHQEVDFHTRHAESLAKGTAFPTSFAAPSP